MLSHKLITFRLLAMCLMVTLVASCSKKQIPVAPESIKELNQAAHITVVHYAPDPFMIMTGEQKARSMFLMLFGLIGGLIEGGMQIADAKEAGVKFISQVQLTDPIMQVNSRFLSTWLPELGLNELAASQLVGDDDVETLQEKFRTGYVLDFGTTDWAVQVLPRWSWSFNPEPPTYRTIYSAQARLIHLEDKDVVWQGTCEFGTDSSLTPVLTRSDIDGVGNGEAVKAAFQTLANNCADVLWRQFFRRDTGS